MHVHRAVQKWRDGPVQGYFAHAEPHVFATVDSTKDEFFRVATALHDAHLIRFTDNHCTCCLCGPKGRVLVGDSNHKLGMDMCENIDLRIVAAPKSEEATGTP